MPSPLAIGLAAVGRLPGIGTSLRLEGAAEPLGGARIDLAARRPERGGGAAADQHGEGDGEREAARRHASNALQGVHAGERMSGMLGCGSQAFATDGTRQTPRNPPPRE
jgi:hypothetical protein